jgi:hypothetical protein
LLYEAGMLYKATGKLMIRHHEVDPVMQNACWRASASITAA